MSLTRVLIDNYCILRYLAVDATEDSDFEFRLLVTGYHTVKKRIQILEEFSPMQPSLGRLRTNGATLKKRVENETSYRQLKKINKRWLSTVKRQFL